MLGIRYKTDSEPQARALRALVRPFAETCGAAVEPAEAALTVTRELNQRRTRRDFLHRPAVQRVDAAENLALIRT